MQMLVVSGSYKNYQNGAVSNQLTDVGRGGESVLGARGHKEMSSILADQ